MFINFVQYITRQLPSQGVKRIFLSSVYVGHTRQNLSELSKLICFLFRFLSGQYFNTKQHTFSGTDEFCVELDIKSEGYMWNDLNCAHSRPYMCEYPGHFIWGRHMIVLLSCTIYTYWQLHVILFASYCVYKKKNCVFNIWLLTLWPCFPFIFFFVRFLSSFSADSWISLLSAACTFHGLLS